MWYFSWVLGLGFAVTFAVLNAMWLEERAGRERRDKQKNAAAPSRAAALSFGCVLLQIVRLADEGRHGVMQLLQRLLMRVHHVSGLVVVELHVVHEVLRHRQVMHLVPALEIG